MAVAASTKSGLGLAGVAHTTNAEIRDLDRVIISSTSLEKADGPLCIFKAL